MRAGFFTSRHGEQYCATMELSSEEISEGSILTFEDYNSSRAGFLDFGVFYSAENPTVLYSLLMMFVQHGSKFSTEEMATEVLHLKRKFISFDEAFEEWNKLPIQEKVKVFAFIIHKED